ncbi:MAG: hypothetical protein LBT08_05395 [Synergistaceae bacterium]|jgi:hypothetical protein|nr:hypothetical protein [Synergistaceae bacterium]
MNSVIIGNYGSGKTEFSLNYAIAAARRGERSMLVDLDIVNPFFRSGYHKELLERENVRLVASRYTLEAADVPVVAPAVASAFDGDYDSVVFDVGGNPVGATALGQYNHRFRQVPPEKLKVLFIVNTFRPLTASVPDILEMLGKVELSSRLKVTGIINNANLAALTEISHLTEGERIVEEAAERAGLPISHHCVSRRLLENSPASALDALAGERVVLEIYTKLDWEDYRPSFPT